ncbi:MAG: hypothetical protein AAF711_13280, partial [Planctomycetota bacterium]
QHFRRLRNGDTTKPGPFELIAWACETSPGSILLGMDLARRTYWAERGGEPGLAWLLTGLPAGLMRAGLSGEQIDRMLIANAISAFSFLPHASPHNTSTLPAPANGTSL